MGKSKKEKRRSENGDVTLEGEPDSKSYEDRLLNLNPIAKPLASRKLTKRLLKTTRKANEAKSLCKGVKAVQKYIRKGGKGLVLLAGDVFPVEVVCHIPVVCEEAGIPYCYVPSKEDLGSACGTARQSVMVLVKKHDDIEDIYDECCTAVQELPLPV